MLKNNVNRILTGTVILIFLTGLSAPFKGVFAAESGGVRFGEPIRGNIVSADEAQRGFKWNGDAGVTLSGGSLWWDQYHNPYKRTNGSISDKTDSPVTYTSGRSYGDVLLTAEEESEYVYYRTVGMRFTLEDISKGDENISTFDLEYNPSAWDKREVKFVDVFLDGVSESVRSRVSGLLAGGASAGGRRRVSTSVMRMKDVSQGDVIESHYCIENFLRRDGSGKIAGDSVVGELISLKSGSDTLPAGEWRIYASHIIEVMAATSVMQSNGQTILKDRRERLIRDGAGKLVPDVRTTLSDALAAARWSTATREEFLPSLFNRYLDLTNEAVISTTFVVNYYIYGKDPRSNIVRTDYPCVEDIMQGRFGSVNIFYKNNDGMRPDNLRIVPGENWRGSIESSGFDGIVVYSGARPDSYGLDQSTDSPTASFLTKFSLIGDDEELYLTPLSTLMGMRESNIVTPYVCIWVPLKSEVRVSVMYVTADDKKPVLLRDGGCYPVDSGGSMSQVPLSVLTGSAAVGELANPMKTTDGSAYTLAPDSADAIRYFYGTDGWNINAGKANKSSDSIKSPKRTFKSLALTGADGDGRKYGVMGQGFSEIVRMPGNRYITDIVYFIKVVKKTDPGPQEPVIDDPGSGPEEQPEEKPKERPKSAEVNIYYIKGPRSSGYHIISSENRKLPAGFYEAAVAEGRLFREFAVRTDVADSRTGVHWKPIGAAGDGDYMYMAITSATAGESLGSDRYPRGTGEEGWTETQYYLNRESDAMYIGVKLSEGAVFYDIFIPCEIRTGNNPVQIFAVEATTGKLLLSTPIATSFMSSEEDLIDISDCEEMTVSGKTYVMVGEILEQKNVYPFKTTAYAYAGFNTQAVPSLNTASGNVVCLTSYLGDATQPANATREEFKNRVLYLKLTGKNVPSGNIVAVYIPFRASSGVNLFLITDENRGLEPEANSVMHSSYSVSRSYWYDASSRLEPDKQKDTAGWFEFDVPKEISDPAGTMYFMTDDEPVALHHDEYCSGILQSVGLCATECPLCSGTGFMTVHGRAGAHGAKEKCSFCGGAGIWVTAMNFNRIPREDSIDNPGTVVKKKCSHCNGSGFDPGLSSHAHEKINCPECNADGKGPTTQCPSCNGRGKIYYETWENGPTTDANGNVVMTSVRVYKEKQCPTCRGSGKFPCGTCDGSGKVDGDLCMHCYEERYYTVGTAQTTRWRVSYGKGYTVERRDICRSCGGKGYSVCRTCNGTGWSNRRDTNGRQLPCTACGGAVVEFMGRIDYEKGRGETACSCTSKSYTADPDPAVWESAYSRGSYRSGTDSYGNSYTYRDNQSFMRGGYYCADCGASILTAGFPREGTIVVRRKDPAKCHITVYGASGISAADKAKLSSTQYREVKLVTESFGDTGNHSPCNLELTGERASYDKAKSDNAHKTTVTKTESQGDDTQRLRLYVPDDSGSKATDVYILYTGWKPFSMPGPEPLVLQPEPYEPEPDLLISDLDTDSCDISIVAGYNRGVIYDPKLSIPSGRDVKLKATGKKYLYDMKLVNITGMIEVPVTVRYPYAFYESAAAYRRGDEPVESGYAERSVTVARPYSYWTIDRFAVWTIKETGAISNVFVESGSGYERIAVRPENDVAPLFTVLRLGDRDTHVIGVPETGKNVITADGFYADIYKNGIRPEIPVIDEGYAQRIANESFPELIVRDDTLLFDGKTILAGSSSKVYFKPAVSGGASGEGIDGGYSGSVVMGGSTQGPTSEVPKESEIITLWSAEKKIPVIKRNGKYPVLAATFSYSKVPGAIGFVDETKYRSTGVPDPVTVHTPVYVKGTLSMNYEGTSSFGQSTGENVILSSNNLRYVELKNADVTRVWAVLGEEREYDGYNINEPSETYTALRIFMQVLQTELTRNIRICLFRGMG